MFKVLHILALTAFILVGVACGPSQEELDRRIDERVQGILSALPTPTPIVFPAPLPTATPVTFPTPLPTPTPMPTATPSPRAMICEGRIVELYNTYCIRIPTTDFNDVYLRVQKSVFFIETPYGTGSGWALEPDLVLTNQHVVAGSTTVTVRHGINAPLPATVVAVDAPRDIALLRLDTSKARRGDSVEALQLGQISIDDIAQTLMALGYSEVFAVRPDGTTGRPSANIGVLSNISGFAGYGRQLLMDAPVDPGDSGGPVFNADGDVVGMVRAVVERTASGQRVVGTFYAVHVDEIRAALPALKAGQSR